MQNLASNAATVSHTITATKTALITPKRKISPQQKGQKMRPSRYKAAGRRAITGIGAGASDLDVSTGMSARNARVLTPLSSALASGRKGTLDSNFADPVVSAQSHAPDTAVHCDHWTIANDSRIQIVNSTHTYTSYSAQDTKAQPSSYLTTYSKKVHSAANTISATDYTLTQLTNLDLQEIPMLSFEHLPITHQDVDHLEITNLLALEAQHPTTRDPMPTELTAIISPLRVTEWTQALQHHPDRQFANYILKGLQQGFHIGFKQQSTKSAKNNMRSSEEHPDPVNAYIAEEVAKGRIVGPLPPDTTSGIHINRFGVIPKRSSPGKWRLILDLSHPEQHSVNDGIDPTLCRVRYSSIDEAVKHVLSLGRHTLLAKLDIAHAYRNIPVHPDDRRLLGMKWKGHTYIDTVLPFGLRSAPRIFCAVASALEWILEQEGTSRSIHYIDDFLTFGAPESDECQRNISTMVKTCDRLGVPLAIQKLEGPSTNIVFLGILLDTDKLEIRLPTEKLQNLQLMLDSWAQKRACTKRELLSLIGTLSHACKVLPPGRTFLRRMIDLSRQPRKMDHWVRLNKEFHSDLTWWRTFLPTWNGTNMMQSLDFQAPPDAHVYTDAAGSWGYGGCWEEKWFHNQWITTWQSQNIATKELLPIVVACGLWGREWSKQLVLFHCDNQSVVCTLKSRTSKDPNIMQLLRCLVFFQAAFKFRLKAEHVPGKLNKGADALSRNSLQVFYKVRPDANQQPTPIPPPLFNMLIKYQPDWLSHNWQQWLRDTCSWESPPALSGPTNRPRPNL